MINQVSSPRSSEITRCSLYDKLCSSQASNSRIHCLYVHLFYKVGITVHEPPTLEHSKQPNTKSEFHQMKRQKQYAEKELIYKTDTDEHRKLIRRGVSLLNRTQTASRNESKY